MKEDDDNLNLDNSEQKQVTETKPIDVAQEESQIAVSSFDVTKGVNLAITTLLIIVLIIDAMMIWRKGITRRSGKSFVHLSLFVLVAIMIILTQSGKIL